MENRLKEHLGKIEISPLKDFQCLNSFCSGVRSMDSFIQNDFRLSIEHHFCTAYIAKLNDEIVALFALSFDSLDLDSIDKEELQLGISSTGTPSIDWNYKDTFYSKPRYPALDIAYLAVQDKWRNKHIGRFLIEMIVKQARAQTLAGCQFITVEALATSEYNAVGFYERCGFTPNEAPKPYKDTLRMYRTLYT